MAQIEAAGGVGRAAEDAAEGLGEGFPGGEAVAGFADVPAEAYAVPVLDEVEEPDPAVVGGPDFGAVGGPAEIGGVGDDAAVVGFGGGKGAAVRGKEAVRAQEAQEAVAADPVAGEEMESRVDFAVPAGPEPAASPEPAEWVEGALAGEVRGGEVGAEEGAEGVILEGGFRPAFGVIFRRRQRRIRRGRRLRGEGGARHFPCGADARDPIAATGGWGDPGRSLERPPRGKRQGAAGLDAEQFVVHGQLADAVAGVIEAELERVGIGPRSQAGEKPRQALLLPVFES